MRAQTFARTRWASEDRASDATRGRQPADARAQRRGHRPGPLPGPRPALQRAPADYLFTFHAIFTRDDMDIRIADSTTGICCAGLYVCAGAAWGLRPITPPGERIRMACGKL